MLYVPEVKLSTLVGYYSTRASGYASSA